MWAPKAGVLLVGSVGLMPQAQLLRGLSGQALVSCRELKLEQSCKALWEFEGSEKVLKCVPGREEPPTTHTPMQCWLTQLSTHRNSLCSPPVASGVQRLATTSLPISVVRDPGRDHRIHIPVLASPGPLSSQSGDCQQQEKLGTLA